MRRRVHVFYKAEDAGGGVVEKHRIVVIQLAGVKTLEEEYERIWNALSEKIKPQKLRSIEHYKHFEHDKSHT